METPSFKEDHISQLPALQLLINMGYQYISPQEALVERGNKTSNVLLENILRTQLKRINRTKISSSQEGEFSENNITAGIRALKEISLVNGYITAAAGKIHDPRTVGEKIKGSNKLKKGDDDLASWSINYNLPINGVSSNKLSMRFENLPDEDFGDGKIRIEGIELM